AGPLLRQSQTQYVTTNNGVNYATDTSIHIRDLVSQRTVYDSSLAVRAQTTYEYDAYSGTNRAPLTQRDSITGLDSSYTASFTRRGNATKISRWISGSTWVDSFIQYDIVGNVV